MVRSVGFSYLVLSVTSQLQYYWCCSKFSCIWGTSYSIQETAKTEIGFPSHTWKYFIRGATAQANLPINGSCSILHLEENGKHCDWQNIISWGSIKIRATLKFINNSYDLLTHADLQPLPLENVTMVPGPEEVEIVNKEAFVTWVFLQNKKHDCLAKIAQIYCSLLLTGWWQANG